jgi:hypothetical protein
MFDPVATNFIGREPMQWWIGQVTDPSKGFWDKSQEKQVGRDGKDVYSHRVRVRIVGYHGGDSDLPDKDLPMAHVLMPPGVSSTGGRGKTMNYQGGEVVVGFFFDGKDGQQPVIFGTLFKQAFVRDRLKKGKFDAFQQTEFIPYTPPEVRQKAGKDKVFKEKNKKNGKEEWPAGRRNIAKDEKGKITTNESIATGQVNKDTNVVVENATACEDNEISKISNAIKAFTEETNALEDIGELTIDPIYGGVMNKEEEIKLTTMKVHSSMSKLMRRGRSFVIQDAMDKLSLKLKDQTPITLQAGVGEAAKNLNDVLFCNFEKINEQLKDYLAKSLENMLGKVLDVPICAVDSFLGDMFGQINNIMDTTMGGTFDQLNNITGGGIGAPSKTFSKAIKFANIVTNTLECDAQNCPPSNTTFSGKGGVGLNPEDAFGDILGIAGLNSLKNKAEGLKDMVDGLIPDISVPSIPKVDCKTNVLKCGPPRVDFIGSTDGKGASGEAIVNVLGQVIGVAITEPGFGYIGPPALTFVDGCDNGYGAGGYVRMKNGSVVDVVITDGGQEYIPNTTETDMDGNVKEVTPDPNANYSGETSYVTALSDLVVENAGFGYDETDTATIVGGVGKAEVELNVIDGRIVGANIVNAGFGFTEIPKLRINSDTGALAKLSPVLEFTKVDDAAQVADITQDAVVTVIDCITK